MTHGLKTGERVVTHDGRTGRIVEASDRHAAIAACFPVMVELDGEDGLFAFAIDELSPSVPHNDQGGEG